MKLNRLLYIIFLVSLTFSACNETGDKNIRIIASTDVHGSIFSSDLVSGLPLKSSMSKVSSYISTQDRKKTILLDNGDNLQGDPSVYYYNFEDTISSHLWADVLNYLAYDAVTEGNHDIEAGHSVYDRVRKEYKFPSLAANAIDVNTGNPYFLPYTIIKRGGLKVAVMGLITPGVPGWLPEVLYKGIRFDDMVETAKKWMPVVKSENPDIIVGLFHSGWNEEYGGDSSGSYLNENASLAVAREVPGFNIIFIGHDHEVTMRNVINISGDTVLVLDGGSHAAYISVADISVKGSGSKRKVNVTGEIIKTDTIPVDTLFDKHFVSQYNAVSNYVKRDIGELARDISSRDTYFGDTPFMDLIHKIQIETTGADVSFAAPLSFNITIHEGTILVKDIFNLYRYENMLYEIKLSGEEIDRYLEYSYGLWTSKMENKGDMMLKCKRDGNSLFLTNRYYDFDSAEGIKYEVDLTKTEGNRVNIISMENGEPFIPEKIYRVALNSYRGSGGGGHLTSGVGLSAEEIKSRLIYSTDKDLRYYMIKWIEYNRVVDIVADNNWEFIPEAWADDAEKRESKALFNH